MGDYKERKKMEEINQDKVICSGQLASCGVDFPFPLNTAVARHDGKSQKTRKTVPWESKEECIGDEQISSSSNNNNKLKTIFLIGSRTRDLRASSTGSHPLRSCVPLIYVYIQ
jgi:hypothetical protein